MCLVAVSSNAFVIQHKFLNFALVTYPKHEAKNKAKSWSKSSEYNVDAKIAYKFNVHEQVGAIVQGSRRMCQKSTKLQKSQNFDKTLTNFQQNTTQPQQTSKNIGKTFAKDRPNLNETSARRFRLATYFVPTLVPTSQFPVFAISFSQAWPGVDYFIQAFEE